jgi:hypothetical protein
MMDVTVAFLSSRNNMATSRGMGGPGKTGNGVFGGIGKRSK